MFRGNKQLNRNFPVTRHNELFQEAPVVARAAILLECAMFVNRCNHGDWPKWMKMNLPGFRQTGLLHSRGQPSGHRRNMLLQRAAGRMFHQWGEVCDVTGRHSALSAVCITNGLDA